MNPPDEAAAVEKLYEYGQRLAEPLGTKNESDYIGIISAAKGSSKSKQLAAQLIPRFFKHFPSLSSEAINAQLDLCEEDELGVSLLFLGGLNFVNPQQATSAFSEFNDSILSKHSFIAFDRVLSNITSPLKQIKKSIKPSDYCIGN